MILRFLFVLICLAFLSCKPTTNNTNYSPLIDYQYKIQSSTKYEKPIDTYKIRYKSDGLEITGYLTKHQDNEKRPTIVFTRGGNRDFGAFSAKSLSYQQYLASHGYNVLASQLRGNMFSEGEDQFGGKDLNDIFKLIEINKTLEFANGRVGIYGFSRGGLNAYQVARGNDEIEVVAVVGAPTDPRLDFDTRPEMYEEVYKVLVGDTINFKAEYDKRSPLLWADEINAPTLILHGRDDWRVKPINAERMIEKMKSFNKVIDYEIIEGGDHGLNTHRPRRNEKVISWLDKYLKD